MKDLFGNPEYVTDAKFNKDRTERYWLSRFWGDEKNCVMFIGLNPSTANESQDDPTIRRVVRFAKDWGYGGIIMCNLFVQVTPYPKELNLEFNRELLDWPIANNFHRTKLYVAAWGNFPEAIKRGREVQKLVKTLHCLGMNKNGSPKHPLYIKADTKPIIFNLRET